LTGIYVGVAVVALLRFLRSRERKLLPVLLLFTLLALAHFGELSTRAAGLLHLAAGLAGLGLVFLLAPHPRNQ
jgi:hypothetical protein